MFTISSHIYMLYISNIMLELVNISYSWEIITMNISTSKKMVMGVSLIIGGLILLSLKILDSTLSLAIVNTGTIIVIAAYALEKRRPHVQHDELSRQISAKATSYSWMITLILISVLVLVHHYQLIMLTVQGSLAAIFIVMNASFLGYRWWFNKTGKI